MNKENILKKFLEMYEKQGVYLIDISSKSKSKNDDIEKAEMIFVRSLEDVKETTSTINRVSNLLYDEDIQGINDITDDIIINNRYALFSY